MPRMREATRSGWNASSASVFSPTPTNFSGCPVIGPDRERRAAARVAIHFGQDDASDAEPLVELIRRLHRVLTGHGVGDKQDFGRVQRFLQLMQFLHQLFVNVQAAGGIDQQNVPPGLHCLAPGGTGQVEWLRFFRSAFVNRNVAPVWPEC